MYSRRVASLLCLTLFVLVANNAVSAENLAVRSAAESITSADLKSHVDVLADDTFEGREAGKRGGRAAGTYLVRALQKHNLKPSGASGGYFQPFKSGYRNLLAMLEGSDPQLKNEVIIVCAHYDHVGYGNRGNSYGPFGYVHNGADDNASGTSGLLEAIEAFSQLPAAPRRSILFAFWDGEEKGLLGSKHWIANPTISLARVKVVVNVDMIGRLRKKVDVYGIRTGSGLRSLVSKANADVGLDLNFTWEMKNNSDHYPFFSRGIPALMLHTGLHDDYHRPSDDAHKINTDGMQDVVRLLFRLSSQLGEEDKITGFRRNSRSDSVAQQRRFEKPLPRRKPRLGVWMKDIEDSDGVVVTRIVDGSAADRFGLQSGDQIVKFAGVPVVNQERLTRRILRAPVNVEIVIHRGDSIEPQTIPVELAGNPVRIGISWRNDPAEPSGVMITQVISASPAHRAGLKTGDRIYNVDGKLFGSSTEFLTLVNTLPSPINLLVERNGKLAEIPLDVSDPIEKSPVAAD